ncbi:MAG: primosomal replication protein N [Sterolibacteriaceae bacterium MAG5]|nr:primosomal replication protein N [Candidatus Nitricoxidireducens bremensis]
MSGKLLERGVLRYTPAGVPAIEFRLGHESEQLEAEKLRRVECEMACIALGTPALMLKDASPGSGLNLEGFIAARSVKSRTPVLHVTKIEYLEGNENGIQTEE